MASDDDGDSDPGFPDRSPPAVCSYLDPVEGFRGWLAIDRGSAPLVAGGFRVRPDLTASTIRRLARAMTFKQQVLGLGVGGAKCGIAYHPDGDGKQRAIRRFLQSLRPWLEECYSMGPDMGTSFDEIEAVAQSLGIPSVKLAAGRAQGLSAQETIDRIDLLDATVDGFTLSERRAGHGLAHAVLAVLDQLKIPHDRARVGLLGFGSLGRGAALALHEAQTPVTVIAELDGAIKDRSGLAVPDRLASSNDELNWEMAPDEIFATSLDILVLAGSQDAVSVSQARRLEAGAVVSGANLALSEKVASVLEERDIRVVPDFVGGCGGSASMDGLFGPRETPTPGQVLDHVTRRLHQIVDEMFTIADRRDVSLRRAALTICRRHADTQRSRPYGHHIDRK